MELVGYDIFCHRLHKKLLKWQFKMMKISVSLFGPEFESLIHSHAVTRCSYTCTFAIIWLCQQLYYFTLISGYQLVNSLASGRCGCNL